MMVKQQIAAFASCLGEDRRDMFINSCHFSVHIRFIVVPQFLPAQQLENDVAATPVQGDVYQPTETPIVMAYAETVKSAPIPEPYVSADFFSYSQLDTELKSFKKPTSPKPPRCILWLPFPLMVYLYSNLLKYMAIWQGYSRHLIMFLMSLKHFCNRFIFFWTLFFLYVLFFFCLGIFV